MNSVAKLKQLVGLAKEHGILVRYEWLDGAGAAVCELMGQPCLFIDLASDPAEQLAVAQSELHRLAGGDEQVPAMPSTVPRSKERAA